MEKEFDWINWYEKAMGKPFLESLAQHLGYDLKSPTMWDRIKLFFRRVLGS